MYEFIRISMISVNVSFVSITYTTFEVGRGEGGIDWKNLHRLCDKLASLGIIRAQLRIHSSPSILKWCDVRGGSIELPMMRRDTSLLNSFTFNRYSFSTWRVVKGGERARQIVFSKTTSAGITYISRLLVTLLS